MSEQFAKIIFERICIPLCPENASALAEQKKQEQERLDKQLDVVLSSIAASKNGYYKLGAHDKVVADILEQQGFKVLVDRNALGEVYAYLVCWDMNKYYEFIRYKGYDILHLNKMFP